MKHELWRVGATIPAKELPEDWEWAMNTVLLERQKPAWGEMEKRICGKWGYGPNPEEHCRKKFG